jgi:hypothetical protein
METSHMKNTMPKAAVIILSLTSAASAALAANANYDEKNGGDVTVAASGNTLAKTSVGQRAEVRYDNSVNSFSGTAKWNAWHKGHAFVQIIENVSGKGFPLLLISTDSSGKIKNIGRVGTKTCSTKVGKGSSIGVTASVSGRDLEITAGGCTFTGTANTDNAYIKFGSYANKSAEGSQSISWTNVSPKPTF